MDTNQAHSDTVDKIGDECFVPPSRADELSCILPDRPGMFVVISYFPGMPFVSVVILCLCHVHSVLLCHAVFVPCRYPAPR